MGMRTFTIELRCDMDTDEKQKIMRDAARISAKHLFTTALMISGDRKPQIALHSGDFFESTEQIQLADDIEE